MSEDGSGTAVDYRLVLLNADIAAQTAQGETALRLLKDVPVETLPVALQAGIYGIRGEAHFRLNQNAAARQDLEKALKLHQKAETASPLQIGQLRNLLAGTYYHENLHRKALKEHRFCLQAVRAGLITETRFQLKLYNNLGNDYLFLGKTREALKYYTQAVRLAVESEDETDRANAFWGTGIVYHQLEEYGKAKPCLETALKLYLKTGNLTLVPRLRSTLGWALVALKEYKYAEQELLTALAEATSQPQNNVDDQILCQLNLAYLYYQQGLLKPAEEYARLGIEQAQQSNNKEQLGLLLAQLAEICLEAGAELNEVHSYFEQAIALLRQTESRDLTRHTYKRFSDAFKKIGAYKEALYILEEGYNFLTEPL